jgi:AGZA family xanthine/uracil permease-like MFS transporter
MNTLAKRLDDYFGIGASGSTLRRELVGGITTFATMSYIVFVQPTVLSSVPGMDFGSVLLATCFASALSTFMMGIYARYPFAQAPGMGENFLFAFTVCGAMGFSFPAGLAIVLISGLLLLLLSVFRTREKIVAILPECLKNAIGPAIGVFIAFVGLQWGGIVGSSPVTGVHLNDLSTGAPLLTIFGFFLIVALMARRIAGGILIGILVTCGIGLFTGIIPWPKEPLTLSTATFFRLDFGELIDKWHEALIAIGLFFFLLLFDTVGTLVGLGKQAGYIGPNETLPRAGRAFLSDATGTCAGALFGTSTVLTYIESATGIAVGARTGLAAVVTAICFLLAPLMAPIVRIVGQDVGWIYYGVEATAPHIAMYPAVAPALIAVGFMMMAPLRLVDWNDVTEGVPAFLTVAMMAFGFAIIEGIAAGVISYAVVKLLAGRPREVHPVLYIVAVALVLRYAFLM